MKTYYITNGTSFSGKSTWALKNFEKENIVESDIHKYDKERTGDLTEYLVNLAIKCPGENVCIVQTNNSFENFKQYKTMFEKYVPNQYKLIVANFELTLDEIKENRKGSNRKKGNIKRTDPYECYYKTFKNSLSKIKECNEWTCITVKREPNIIESFLE